MATRSCINLLVLTFISGNVVSHQFQTNLLSQSHLGKHPTGGESLSDSNIEDGRNQFQRLCCCSSSSTCPNAYTGMESGYSDSDIGSGIISPRLVGLRIANQLPTSELNKPSSVRTCPIESTKCCYENIPSLSHLGDRCTTSSQEESFQQSCPSNVPSSGVGKTCGTRDFTHAPDRAQGQSSPEEFPWTCLILTLNNEFVGSCVIIPERFDNQIQFNTRKVLTVAHMIKNYNSNELKIRALDYDARGFNFPEQKQHIEYRVSSYNIHPHYDGVKLGNDIAVLRTDKYINLQRPGVNAACLPSCSNMFEHVFQNGTGARCWVAGWGRDKVGGSFSVIQKKVDVPLVPSRKCEAQLKQALRGRSRSAAQVFRLHKSEICAGGEPGKDACEGDGGAPLVCQSVEGRWHVLGLVTWGIGCASKDVPGVYANVYYFRNWLESV